MKQKLYKKALSVALSALMLITAGIVLPAVVESGTVTVSAAQTYGDYSYEVKSDNTVTLLRYYGSGSNVTTPAFIDGKRVTRIGKNTFYENKNLTNVTIPSGVTSIGPSAFRGCVGLTSVTIPSSVKSIGGAAFCGCCNLKSINIPSGVTGILKDTFYCCRSLTDVVIPPSVTYIDSYAFYGCNSLTNANIPYGVKAIWRCAFSGCTKLTDFTVPSSVVYIGDHAFYCCYGLTGIDAPSQLKTIEYRAFGHCRGLTDITIPGSVTSINNQAFYKCTGLKNITIEGGVTSISDGAFYECTGLKNVTLEEGLTSIGNQAFYHCKRLENITIPNSLKTIGYDAFDGTIWLNDQPDGVVYAGKVAYKYKGEMYFGTDIILKDDTVGIASKAFEGYNEMTGITIPDSVINIGDNAFNGCLRLTIYGVSGSSAARFASLNKIHFEPTKFIKVTGITLNKTSTVITKGNSINLNAKITPSDATNKSAIWTTSDSSVATVSDGTVTGIAPGTAVIKAEANNGMTAECLITVREPLTNETTLSSTTLTLGETLTLTCSATGGTDPYQYAVYFKKGDASSFSKYSDFSAEETINFVPQSAAIYTIRSKVKDQAGRVTNKDFTVNVVKPLTNTSTLTGTTLTLGESLIMTGSAAGGTGPYLYALLFKKGDSAAFSQYTGFGMNNSISFKPQSATNYTLRTAVKDQAGRVAYKDFSVKVIKPFSNTSTISAKKLALGSSLTVTGSASEGVGPYMYALFTKEIGAADFTQYRGFSTDNVITFAPENATTYILRIMVMDQEVRVAYKDFTVNVTQPLKNTTTLSTTNLTLGESLTMTGSATGGTSPYQYALFFKKSGSSDFTKYKDFSTTGKITFKPQSATTYILRTKVKDNTGKVIYKDFTVKVTK